MKKLFAFALAIAIACLFTPSTARADGALAIGRDGHFGMSWNQSGQRRAEEKALSECTGNCVIREHFSHTCAAYASGEPGEHEGWGHAPSEREARQIAMDECEKNNRHCVLRASGCDD